jgi:hypothetical protein
MIGIFSPSARPHKGVRVRSIVFLSGFCPAGTRLVAHYAAAWLNISKNFKT